MRASSTCATLSQDRVQGGPIATILRDQDQRSSGSMLVAQIWRLAVDASSRERDTAFRIASRPGRTPRSARAHPRSQLGPDLGLLWPSVNQSFLKKGREVQLWP